MTGTGPWGELLAQSTPTQTPSPTPMPFPGENLLAEWLPAAWGLEERLAVSAGVLLFVFVASRLLVPWTIGRAQRTYRDRLPTDQLDEWLVRVDERLPFAVTTYYVVRTFQLSLVAVAALVLLVVWGLTNVAMGAVTVFLNNVNKLFRLLFSLALIVAAYVAVGLLEEFVDRLSQESGRLDEHQGEVVFRVLQLVLLASAGLVVLGIWNVNLGGLLVGAGFLGIVVGMAARQTLGSLLAGFVLMFSKPFEVGDWIEVDGNEGVVTDITIMNTRMENFDGEYVVMPNDVISNSTIVNRTRKGRLRIRLEVGIDYAVDPERAETVAKEAVKDLDEVMSVPRPQVVPTAFGDSAITLELRFWIDKPSSRRRWRARAAVLRAVYDAFEREGIKIPFPQRELSGRAETGGFRVNRREAAPEEPATDGEPVDGDGAPSSDDAAAPDPTED